MMDVVSVVLYIPFESHNSAALRESYQFAFNLHLIKLVMPLIFLYLSGFRFIFGEIYFCIQSIKLWTAAAIIFPPPYLISNFLSVSIFSVENFLLL